MGIPPKHLHIGKLAEQTACQFLNKKGFRLLHANFICRFGEIDLIMEDQAYLIFVEVKYRSEKIYGLAKEKITPSKKHKLGKTALYFLQSKNWLYKKNSRFDVIAIQGKGQNMNLEWIQDAFRIDYF